MKSSLEDDNGDDDMNFLISVSGDFNTNFAAEEAKPLIRFMEKKFLLSMNNSKTEGTTKYGTTLDAVFIRHIEIIQ